MPRYPTNDIISSMESPVSFGLDEEVSYDINTIIDMVGEYHSASHNWGETVKYHNIDYDVTLNGCTVECTIEVSHDNFEHIQDSYSFELEDGQHFKKLTGLVYDTAYVRYKLNLTSQVDNSTPRIHKLVMNVEGLTYTTHVNYMSFNMIAVSSVDVQFTLDVLFKKGVTRQYMLDLIALKYGVDTDVLLDTLLRGLELTGYSIDTILLMLGIYRSAVHSWGQTVEYANFVADSTLYGCTIEVTVQVSDDNFTTIKDEHTYTLSGGEETIKLTEIDNSAYARYRIELKSLIPGSTPRLHKLIMNVEGLGYGELSKSYSLDLLLLSRDNTTSFAFDLITTTMTKYILFNIDTILKLVPTLQYDLDVLTKLTDRNRLDLDTLLSIDYQSSQYILDIILSGGAVSLSRFNLDTLLKAVEAKTFLLDVLVSTTNLERSYVLDMLTRSEEITDYSIDAHLSNLGVDVSYILDVILTEGARRKQINFDVLLKLLKVDESYIIDVILEKANLVQSYTLDVITTLTQYGYYDLDSILERFGIKSSYIIDAILTGEYKTVDYSIDTYLKLIKSTNVSLDVILKYVSSAMYDINVILAKQDVDTSIFGLDVMIWLGLIWIDQVIPDTSSLFGVTTTIDNLYNILSSISASYGVVPSHSSLMNILSDISNSYSVDPDRDVSFTIIPSNISSYIITPTRSGGFEVIPSNNDLYTITSSFGNSFEVIPTKSNVNNVTITKDAADNYGN